VYVVHVAIDSSDSNAPTFWVQVGGPPTVPEPASMVLLGLGGLSLAGLRRRRR